jgi:uncharacterized protein YndB with AHSA1/START domain
MNKVPIIRWRVHLRSAPAAVFRMLATAEDRARFWAESAEEVDGIIRFRFSNGQQLNAEVRQRVSPSCFQLSYFGGSVVAFELQPDESGGTDLTLTEEGAPSEEYEQNRAGWVSLLQGFQGGFDKLCKWPNYNTLRHRIPIADILSRSAGPGESPIHAYRRVADGVGANAPSSNVNAGNPAKELHFS